MANSRSGRRPDVVIAGIGQTAAGALHGRDPNSLNAEAVRGALADAGVEKHEVDALFVKYPTSDYRPMYGQTLAEVLGIQPRIGGVWDQGGATNISMISYAAMAIEFGQCDVAVVTMADNPKTGTRRAYERAWGEDAVHGWLGVPAGYAMIARRHMEQFGTTQEQLGAVAIACRRHGAANEAAQLRQPLSLDAYMESRFIVDPLRRDDCCLVSDGGAAVVLMSRERAEAHGITDTVPILGFGQGQTSWNIPLRPDLTSTHATVSARSAFAMAGIGPADIDVAQIYDCFTITVITTLEDYGFCAKGEGGPFVEGGRIEHGGQLPLNTSGGLLSETGMPGMQLVLEGVRQVRGHSPNQVNDVNYSLVSNQGGQMHTHSTLILGRS